MQDLINALSKAEAYPHPVKEIKVIVTAISVVFLTGDFAYKICKPLNLGFLDFSTLEKRKLNCEKEFEFNHLITPEIYLGVEEIRNEAGKIKVGRKEGEITEYALKMKQMDPNSIMNKLLKENKIGLFEVKALAQNIFHFHQIAPTNAHISKFGELKEIKFNWDENFQKTERYKEKLISKEDFAFIQDNINKFMGKNKALFQQRADNGKIKHCHGDFHSENVFMANDKIFIFDGIAFNERFPYSDIIAEIAYLAMDLDFYDRKDLSEEFILEYQMLSQDKDIPKLLNFYKCYRAYIRGWVNCFTWEDTNLSLQKKEEHEEKARKYFALAKSYLLDM